MNVCLIWDSEYPWDVRLEKVARSLTAAGHRVDIAARNRTRLPLVEALPEGTVHRMPPMPGRSDRMEAALSFPAFVNPRWFALVHAVATKGPADVIVCRDLPLAPIAIAAGRRLGRPVVLDLAENYPAMIQAVWDHGRQRPWDWLVRNPRAARAVERWVVRRVDHTIVVVEESRDRLVELGVDPDRITVSLNTPLGERIPARVEPVTPGLPLRLVYIGLLEAPRGLSVVLRALARCRDEDVPVQIEVVGDGRDRKILEDESAALGLGEDRVRFRGRLPYEEALAVVRGAHVGIVPHLANDSWNSTIPNKLFDYMSMGRPVVTSDARPAARIVSETGCGAVYPSNDPEALAEAIRSLLDPAVRAEKGSRGRRAVLERFRWDVDGGRVVEAVERAAGFRPPVEMA